MNPSELTAIESKLRALREDTTAILRAINAALDTVVTERANLDSGIEFAITTAESWFNVTRTQLFSRKRSRNIVWARWALLMACRKVIKLNLGDIERQLGVEHTTAMYGIKQLTSDMENDHRLEESVHCYLETIRGYVEKPPDSGSSRVETLESATLLSGPQFKSSLAQRFETTKIVTLDSSEKRRGEAEQLTPPLKGAVG